MECVSTGARKRHLARGEDEAPRRRVSETLVGGDFQASPPRPTTCSCPAYLLSLSFGNQISCPFGSKKICLFHIFIRFSDRIDRMKNAYGNFIIQSQSRNDFFTRGKSVSPNQKSAVKMNQ